MLRSMTGFGRGDDTIGGRHIVFEIQIGQSQYLSLTPGFPGAICF